METTPVKSPVSIYCFQFVFISYFSGIQQENRHIRQLQHENKELRAALEEHQVGFKGSEAFTVQ